MFLAFLSFRTLTSLSCCLRSLSLVECWLVAFLSALIVTLTDDQWSLIDPLIDWFTDRLIDWLSESLDFKPEHWTVFLCFLSSVSCFFTGSRSIDCILISPVGMSSVCIKASVCDQYWSQLVSSLLNWLISL